MSKDNLLVWVTSDEGYVGYNFPKVYTLINGERSFVYSDYDHNQSCAIVRGIRETCHTAESIRHAVDTLFVKRANSINPRDYDLLPSLDERDTLYLVFTNGQLVDAPIIDRIKRNDYDFEIKTYAREQDGGNPPCWETIVSIFKSGSSDLILSNDVCTTGSKRSYGIQSHERVCSHIRNGHYFVRHHAIYIDWQDNKRD